MSISPTYLCENIVSRKNNEVEEIVIEKWHDRWLDVLISMFLLGPDFIARVSWYFEFFRGIFQPK